MTDCHVKHPVYMQAFLMSRGFPFVKNMGRKTAASCLGALQHTHTHTHTHTHVHLCPLRLTQWGALTCVWHEVHV